MPPPNALVVLMMLLLLAACQADPSEQTAAALSSPPFRTAERIVFFGDSITEMGDRPGGYVRHVADALDEAYPELGIEVIGAGISGNKVPDLLARVERDVLAYEPTTVVVYIGINDVWHWALPGHSGTPEAVFRDGLRTLVDTLRQAGARVLVCTPSVIGERRVAANPHDDELEAYAAISRAVAAEAGAEVCDLREAFTRYLEAHNPDDAAEGILTTDGVHLNDAGNRFVADRMLEALRR